LKEPARALNRKTIVANKRKSIPVSQIRSGKIRHKSLSPEQEEIARQIYASCGHLVYPSFEQWELGFLRDSEPSQELAIWRAIAQTFERLHALYPNKDQKQLLGQVVTYSMGGTPTAFPEIAEIYRSVCKELTGGGGSG
jgi:hypothetical protein